MLLLLLHPHLERGAGLVLRGKWSVMALKMGGGMGIGTGINIRIIPSMLLAFQ